MLFVKDCAVWDFMVMCLEGVSYGNDDKKLF